MPSVIDSFLILYLDCKVGIQYADIVFYAKVLYAYGQYQDLLTPSDQGKWLIKERNLVYMVSVNKVEVYDGFY